MQRRYNEQAKGVDRLEPKRHRSWNTGCIFPCREQPKLSAYGENLTDRVEPSEHGKPEHLPVGDSKPQGLPMGVRVKEEGKSERRAVIARIGFATA